MSASKNLQTISVWVDDANRARVKAMSRADLEHELLSSLRVTKVIEERGETIEAWIGATGQNPRKGVTGCVADVVKELLDVAVTALAAVEHFQGNDGASTMGALADHLAGLVERIQPLGDQP